MSTTLSRNGSGKGRAEPGMKGSKKEEGHLVGREITKARLDLQGTSRGGDCGDPGGGLLRHSPTCSPSTAPSAGPAAFPGKTPPADGATTAARPTRLPRRAPPAGAPASSSLAPPGGGASPRSEPAQSCFFSLFPTGCPARGFHQSLGRSGLECLDLPCCCALLSLLGSIGICYKDVRVQTGPSHGQACPARALELAVGGGVLKTPPSVTPAEVCRNSAWGGVGG